MIKPFNPIYHLQFIFIICFLSIIKISCTPIKPPDVINPDLDFERVTFKDKPAGWIADQTANIKLNRPVYYMETLDSLVVYAGHYSLRMECINQANHPIGSVETNLPAYKVQGKHIHFGGYIKTENVTNGKASFYMRFESKSGILFEGYTPSNGITGTHDWNYYSIDTVISDNVTYITIEARFNGTGTAWFDHIDVSIDGVPFTDNVFYHLKTEKGNDAPDSLNANQTLWLRNHIDPITTIIPDTAVDDDPNIAFKDMQSIEKLIMNAHVVGLGESAHGTHEFMEMKHRFMEFLVRKMGFTVFAIEANEPDVDLLDDYVQTGIGDPVALIHNLEHPEVQTSINPKTTLLNANEFLNMIEWMRTYNESKCIPGPIHIAGFDMEGMQPAIDSIRTFLYEVDPTYAKAADSIYAQLLQYQLIARYIYRQRVDGVAIDSNKNSYRVINYTNMLASVEEINWHLELNKNAYYNKLPVTTVNHMLHYADIVRQALILFHSSGEKEWATYRDTCMALNVEWMRLQNTPATKFILSAHNGHIAKSNGMGLFLDKSYKTDYISIGFLFHKGSRNGFVVENNASVIDSIQDETSYPSTFEWLLHGTRVSRFFLNLHDASIQDTSSAWLTKPMLIHNIQYGDVFKEFFVQNLSNDFDGLVFIDNINPYSKLK